QRTSEEEGYTLSSRRTGGRTSDDILEFRLGTTSHRCRANPRWSDLYLGSDECRQAGPARTYGRVRRWRRCAHRGRPPFVHHRGTEELAPIAGSWPPVHPDVWRACHATWIQKKQDEAPNDRGHRPIRGPVAAQILCNAYSMIWMIR